MAVERQREYALPKDIAPDECTIGRVAGLEFEHSDIRYHGDLTSYRAVRIFRVSDHDPDVDVVDVGGDTSPRSLHLGPADGTCVDFLCEGFCNARAACAGIDERRIHGDDIGIGRRLPRDESHLPDEAGIPVKLT